jgi:membrane associated rhomboid family serine protease
MSVFQRRTTGSVVCPSCGSLVGVRDDKCYSCGRSNPGLWGYGPLVRKIGADFGFVPVVVGGSSVLYVVSLLLSGSRLQIAGGGFSFLTPSFEALLLLGMSGTYPVFQLGWWWTLLTASWLHGNLLHILFNMMWVRDLGTAMVDFVGTSRTIIIYTISGVCGFLMSSVAGLLLAGVRIPFLNAGVSSVGASAAIFGLLGAMVHYGRSGAGSSFVHATAMRYAVILFIFGLIMPGVDNFAHAGGFVGGYATSAFLKPATRERGDHMIGAVVCVAATALALVYNVLHALPLFLR